MKGEYWIKAREEEGEYIIGKKLKKSDCRLFFTLVV
tara:strand:- start:38 stop:145 length:108 start_codon:yes stop_codon:yes gene_type:complete